jgi:hypothetical protein
MEDDLNKNKNGRRPKKKIKKIEDDLTFFFNGRRHNFFFFKDDLNKNGRRTNQPKSAKLAVTPL